MEPAESPHRMSEAWDPQGKQLRFDDGAGTVGSGNWATFPSNPMSVSGLLVGGNERPFVQG